MFNFLNISDSKALIPIALLAAVGIGGYFLWTRAQANKAQADMANAQAWSASANAVPNTGQLANLALLSSLFGGTTGSNAPPAGQPTYSAPAATSNPVGSGSSVGNTPVTQGV
jgi:predicted membrane-bound mannosyltransferase